jgi:hypothetical protein
MRPRDIAIQLTVTIATRRYGRRAAWPLHVNARDVSGGFEGLSGQVGVYQDAVRIGAFDVALSVFFGRPIPTTRQLSRANAELRRARLP